MKNNVSIYVIVLVFFLFNSFAQKTNVALIEKKIEPKEIRSGKVPGKANSPTIGIIYHVEEKINMKFGGYTITYDVSDPSLINTFDLGPDNTRVITTSFVKQRQLKDEQTKTNIDSLKSSQSSYKLEEIVSKPSEIEYTKKTNDSAYIDILKIYQKVADKGYKSINIFKKLGDAYYFKLNLDKAAKYYAELFVLTTDVDPEYYYRYAHCLKSIGQTDKGNKMLEVFNQKTGNDKKITAK